MYLFFSKIVASPSYEDLSHGGRTRDLLYPYYGNKNGRQLNEHNICQLQ